MVCQLAATRLPDLGIIMTSEEIKNNRGLSSIDDDICHIRNDCKSLVHFFVLKSPPLKKRGIEGDL